MSVLQPPLIELANATVLRGGRVALDDISLRIGVGEHVAILGPNGCGKSTLVKTLTRECYPLARPQSSVRIFGKAVWHVFELRPLLGIVSNDFRTHDRSVSARDVVRSGFFSSVGLWPHQVVTGEMTRRAGEALELLAIQHLADRDFDELSSGEARRVLIARAIVHSPKALLLDEPSTSLDLFAQHELRNAMRRLAQAGIAILLVTHHLSDIIPEIGRVILMSSGRIVADGPRSEMLSRERVEALFGTPVDISERGGYVHAW